MADDQKTVRFSVMVECIKAAHLSNYSQSAFSHACGLFLVGSPGVLKSTLLESLEHYETALPLSDINNKTLAALRGRLTTNAIRTLVFPELARIYERDPRTATGIEGTLRCLVEEGWHGASFEDTSVSRFKARATIIGAMTESFRDENWERWQQTGFARRFIWCLIRLQNPEILLDAVEHGVLAQLSEPAIAMNTPEGKIPQILTESERKKLRPIVRKQPHPPNVQYEMLCRIANVLKWQYRQAHDSRDFMETVLEFGNCVIGGADLVGLKVPKFNGRPTSAARQAVDEKPQQKPPQKPKEKPTKPKKMEVRRYGRESTAANARGRARKKKARV